MGFDIDLDGDDDVPTEMDTTHETGTPVESTTITTTTTVVTEVSHSGSKKPRLNDTPSDFQLGYKTFVTWADNAEKTLIDVSRFTCYLLTPRVRILTSLT